LIHMFEAKLEEGQVYEISSFSVVPESGFYRTTLHPYKLVFQIRRGTIHQDTLFQSFPSSNRRGTIYPSTRLHGVNSSWAGNDMLSCFCCEVIFMFFCLLVSVVFGSPLGILTTLGAFQKEIQQEY
jgi:hypothetical protein